MSKFFLISLVTTGFIFTTDVSAKNHEQAKASIETYYKLLSNRIRVKAAFYDNGEVQTLDSGRQRRTLSPDAMRVSKAPPEEVARMKAFADEHFSFTNFHHQFGRVFVRDSDPYDYSEERLYYVKPFGRASGKVAASKLREARGINPDIIIRD